MRRAAKVDGNQAVIVQTYRDCGALVQSLAALGRGVPDLLVSIDGVLALVEVKQRSGTLTPAQVNWHTHWDVAVVRTIDDVARHVQRVRATAAARDGVSAPSATPTTPD